MPAIRFPIRIGRRSRPYLRLWTVTPDTAYVDVDDELDVHFGRFGLRTPVANLASWRIEGPWLWLTAIGVRTSLRHHDVTFSGSPHGGVRVNFRQPVPFAFYHIPALYLTVDDLDAFAAALSERGISGEDARKRKVPRLTPPER